MINWDLGQLNQWCCTERIPWIAVRIICSFSIGVVCICGDFMMAKFTTESRLNLALIDNITHGLTGLLVALVIISYFHHQLGTFQIVLSTLLSLGLSSIVDVDHFIEARSLSIKEATSLSYRPFLHSTTIVIILFICVWLVKRRNRSLIQKLPLLVGLTGVFVHHTRDAVRRGYWFYPFGNTQPLSYSVYIAISILTPNLYYLVEKHQNYIILKSSNTFFV